MGAKEPGIYQAYGATMVSWGGQARQDTPEAVADFVKQRIEPAHQLKLRYCPGLAFRTAFAGMIEFDARFADSITRDLDGRPINVPWLWDHKHQEKRSGQVHPAYWFCTNAPGYQAYLRDQTKRAVVGHADGLHIDDYGGTSGCPGGCFCPYCLVAFTAWLKQNATPAELQAAGIGSLDGFDYAQFLKSRGVTADTVRQKRWTLPLNGLYETFQVRASRDFVASIRRYAEGLRGGPLLLSVNSSASSAGSLVIAPVIDYFCGEVGHHADREQVPDEPVFVYKMTDALGKGSACTADGWDWAFVMAQKRPGLVRTWIAQGYAFGHSLMAPHYQWAYTKEKGTHWYQSQPSDYAHLYRFVREHADLFDGYDSVETAAVLYSNPAFRRWKRTAIGACGLLTRLNVPFGLALAGDHWLPNRLSADTLQHYRAIVVPEPTFLEGEQQAALAAVGDRVVTWPEKPDAAAEKQAADRLRALCGAPLEVKGAAGVVAVARVKRGAAAAPAVVHLLNRGYVGAKDEVKARTGFTLQVANATYGRAFTRAMLHAPGEPSRALNVSRAGDSTVVAVDRLGLWAVLKLE